MRIDGQVLMQIWDFIAQHFLKHGRAPTHRDIEAGVGHVSRSAVGTYLEILHEMGVIRYEGRIARGTRLLVVPAAFDQAAAENEFYAARSPAFRKLLKHVRKHPEFYADDPAEG